MRYNTGNPVEPNGSRDPRDLIDNAQIADKLINSSDLTWLGRLGKTLKTWAGMTSEHNAAQAERVVEFNEFLLSSGYETPVDYVAGLSITRPTKTVRFSGELYRAKDASLPFTTTTWAADSSKFFAIGDAVLRQELAGVDGDAKIGVKQPFTGSAAITQHDKNAQTVHINDFPSTPANTWLSRAIDGTPDGGVLQLGAGPYIAKFTKIRSNIRIEGMCRPRVNVGETALIGGTVIQGTFAFTGSSVSIAHLGVDVGQLVCNALNGGAAMDALVLNDAARNDLKDCAVDHCISLAPHAGAAHGFLLEGCVDSHFTNLHSYGGLWGTVMKTQRSTVNGVYAYGCTEAGFTFKSDTGVAGAVCRKSSAANIYVSANGYADCKTGILLYAATSSMDDIQLSNYKVDGCFTPLKLVCDTRATNTNLLLNAQLSNGVLRGGTVTGYESYGAVRGVQINNLYIAGTTSGKSIQIGADNLGTFLNGVVASCPGAIDATQNVSLSGRFTADNLFSVVSDDFSTPAGILIVVEAFYTARFGSVIGNLRYGGAGLLLALANGWTGFFRTPKITVNNGFARLAGRVAVPPTPWAGKSLIGTFPVGASGQGDARYFMAPGYDAAGKITPVLVRVQGNSVLIDEVATSTAFPATVIWVCLDGIMWPINE